MTRDGTDASLTNTRDQQPSRITLLLSRVLKGASRYWLLCLGVVCWQIASTNVAGLSIQLPAPTDVVSAAIELLKKGTLQADILASLRRVAVAMLFASCVGFPLGALLGGSQRFAWPVAPIVNFFRPIPPLAWIPLSILWFGIGDLQNEFIIFLAAVFPIVTNTAEGVRDVDARLIRAARTLGARGPAILFTVILPAALPSMFVGLRIGIGIAWMALVAGELVAATSGLGFLISQGRLLFRSDYIVVGMVAIGLIGLLLDALVRTFQNIVTPWRADVR
jgi:ABC-type nitrate/sulfonate/bicarbonate transport system permease component